MKLDLLTHRLVGAGAHNQVVVLMYHSITEARRASWNWEITLADFRDHLDYLLDRSINVFPVRRLLDDDCPSSGVVITFDDGYANNLTAAEMLHARGLSATWYVATKDIGKENSWAKGKEPVLPMMDADDIRALDEMGMEVGAHSRSHCDLTSQTSNVLKNEIGGSKQDLETILSKPVDSFAYPYGRYNEAVIDTVRDAGFKTACITRSGWYRPEEDKLQIRRVAVFGGDTVSVFARKLLFADNDVGWGRVLGYYARRLSARVGG